MTLIAQFQWPENKDPADLLLIFWIFFAVLALITLIYWIFFLDDGESKDHSSHDRGYSDRSTGNDASPSYGEYSPDQDNGSSFNNGIRGDISYGAGDTSEVSGYSAGQSHSFDHSSSNSMEINRTTEIDYDSMPEVNQFTRIEAEAYFRDDIFNSYARWDEEFGVIYIVPPGPKKVDDLTAIEGISYEFQRELHRIGIFMYKQIASWPNDTCRNISRELNSGDLLFRQNWPDQARRLHFDKYREEITPAE